MRVIQYNVVNTPVTSRGARRLPEVRNVHRQRLRPDTTITSDAVLSTPLSLASIILTPFGTRTRRQDRSVYARIRSRNDIGGGRACRNVRDANRISMGGARGARAAPPNLITAERR
ncbi:hypothetical protein EVAR_87416_1 [Eumeta japonica]|uniref:Uncharacterized protein n=1 Tax=Eumeta variegata TaxID=151549 RepID=A0A4C1XKJ9_EUMVA|nr:hypothetical protein EVAR_87416_1 [Eumeta japonica]